MNTDTFALDRRALLGRALLLLGVTAVPIEGLLAAQGKPAKPFLSAPRLALLSAVADTIIPRTDTPGASEVGVPKLLDGMLRDWAGPSQRDALIGALDKIDTLARQQHGKSFAALDPQTRETFVIAHDIAALKPIKRPAESVLSSPPATVVDPNYGRPKQAPAQTPVQDSVPGKAEKTGESAAVIAAAAVADPGYQKLKELIVTLYYYSESALTQELAYEHNPGTWQPSVPVTPKTRATGGVGQF